MNRWCLDKTCSRVHEIGDGKCAFEKCAYEAGDERCGRPPHDGSRYCTAHCDASTCPDRPARPGPAAVDMVKEPPHYRSVYTIRVDIDAKTYVTIPAGKLEARHVIEAFGLNWHAGNVAKYLMRAGRKGPALEDLAKAENMIRMLIEFLKESA